VNDRIIKLAVRTERVGRINQISYLTNCDAEVSDCTADESTNTTEPFIKSMSSLSGVNTTGAFVSNITGTLFETRKISLLEGRHGMDGRCQSQSRNCDHREAHAEILCDLRLRTVGKGVGNLGMKDLKGNRPSIYTCIS
jgi:hypothetical protein